MKQSQGTEWQGHWVRQVDKEPLQGGVLRQDLSEVKECAMQISGGKSFQTEGIAGAKILRVCPE